ncbi:hypothetical protein As57867_003083, partial [Aphanomyces stellatus]
MSTCASVADPDPMASWTHSLTFALNGTKVVVDANTTPRFHDLRLIDYLRDHARLTGTKLACGEGGCGACTVVLGHRTSATDQTLVHRSVNACLIPLASIDGMAVFTVEGIGSTKGGLHAIQKRMVINYAMQCGFCTSGWVTNMYELLKNTPEGAAPTLAAVEAQFDGNLCRCTGYRPILKTMHSFAAPTAERMTSIEYDANEMVDEDPEGDPESFELIHHEDYVNPVDDGASHEHCDHSDATRAAKKCTSSCDACPHATFRDLEDLIPYDKGQDPMIPSFIATYTPVPLHFEQTIDPTTRHWYRVLSLTQLDQVQAKHTDDVMLVGGRTSRGVTKYFNDTAPYVQPPTASIFVDITHIPELSAVQITDSAIVVGGAVTLAVLLKTLQSVSKTNAFVHVLALHIGKIANHQVRNAGTWAGNIEMARQFKSFPSDLVTALVGYGASVTVRLSTPTPLTMSAFLALTDTKAPLLISLTLPLYADTATLRHTFRCHKVAQRRENSHAHVNAAIFVVVNATNVVTASTIVFGGVGPDDTLVRCTQTENAIQDQVLTTASLQRTLDVLTNEVNNPDPFKGSVVRTFWYKTMLKAAPSLSSAALKSGVNELPRRVSGGQQVIPTHKDSAPVGNAIPKLSSNLLVSGEAKYVADMPPIPGLLYGALVFSTQAPKRVLQIDDAAARRMPGVVDVVTAGDIPGTNLVGDGTETLFVPIYGSS